MPLLTAVETLEECRSARARGDVDTCLRLSVAAASMAVDEGLPDVAFLAACAPARLYMSRGEGDLAAGWYRNALYVALEGGLTRRLPEVYHDLFVVSRDGGDRPQARRYFSASLELYLDTNARHPRLVALHADVAETAFMRNPSPDTAADALLHWRSFSAALADPVDRFLGGCSIMAAAAWLGLHNRYLDGVAMMEAAYPRLPDHLGVSLALSHAAGGAIRARDYTRGLSLAQEALRVAVERGEPVAEERAREVMNAALAERQLRG